MNYSCPNHIEDYVHRVGRTGRAGVCWGGRGLRRPHGPRRCAADCTLHCASRPPRTPSPPPLSPPAAAGRKGTAITFITPNEGQYAADLMRALRDAKQPGRITPELRALADAHVAKVDAGEARKRRSGYGGSGFKFDGSEQSADQAVAAQQRRMFELEAGMKTIDEVLEVRRWAEAGSGRARVMATPPSPLPLQEDEAKVAAAEEKAAAVKAATEERAAEAVAAAAAPRYVPADEVTLARLSAIARASALAVAAGHGNAAAAEAAAAALAEAQTKGVLVQPDPATVAAAAAAAIAGGGGAKKSAAAAAADARSNVDMARDFAAVISRQLGITEGAAGTPTGAWGGRSGRPSCWVAVPS